MKKFMIISIICLNLCLLNISVLFAQNWGIAQWVQFHQQAMEESMILIRQGEPSKFPFWNKYAKRFIYAPSFDFKQISDAKEYLITATSDENYKEYSFNAKYPWVSLKQIWNEIPIGIVQLKIEGLD